MFGVPLQILLVTSVMLGQRTEEAQIVVVRFSSVFVTVERHDPSIFYNVVGKVLVATDQMPSDLGHEERHVGDHIYHPL